MGLSKGMTNNPAGRPQGSKNKVGLELREKITEFLEGKFDEVAESWETLEPKDKIVLYEKLLTYALPKLQTVAEDASQQIVVNWHETRMHEPESQILTP